MRTLLLGMALAACASGASRQPPTTTAASAAARSDPKRAICKEETPTGSSISREVCRTPEEVEAERRGADDLLRNQGSRLGAEFNGRPAPAGN